MSSTGRVDGLQIFRRQHGVRQHLTVEGAEAQVADAKIVLDSIDA